MSFTIEGVNKPRRELYNLWFRLNFNQTIPRRIHAAVQISRNGEVVGMAWFPKEPIDRRIGMIINSTKPVWYNETNLKEIFDWSFDNLDADVIYVEIESNNVASIKACQRFARILPCIKTTGWSGGILQVLNYHLTREDYKEYCFG